jgi:threonine/homoserine/homoserine lactone efflux protein
MPEAACHTGAVGAHLLVFVGVAAIVILLPGPDTAVVTKNAQFVDPGRPVLLPFMALGALFVLMTVLWLAAYRFIAARAAETLRRPRVRAALDRLTGFIVLLGTASRLCNPER